MQVRGRVTGPLTTACLSVVYRLPTFDELPCHEPYTGSEDVDEAISWDCPARSKYRASKNSSAKLGTFGDSCRVCIGIRECIERAFGTNDRELATYATSPKVDQSGGPMNTYPPSAKVLDGCVTDAPRYTGPS